LTQIFKQNAKLSANITDIKFGDQSKPHKNSEFTEQQAPWTGIPASETDYASTSALFHCMIGLIRLGTRFLSGNLTLPAKKTAYNASPAKCNALRQR
jgi:hypothetical protein